MLCVQFLFWYIAHNWDYEILATPARTVVKTSLNISRMFMRRIDHYPKDGGPFVLHVVFTIMPCGKNIYLVRYEAHIHKLTSNCFSEYVHLILKPYDLK